LDISEQFDEIGGERSEVASILVLACLEESADTGELCYGATQEQLAEFKSTETPFLVCVGSLKSDFYRVMTGLEYLHHLNVSCEVNEKFRIGNTKNSWAIWKAGLQGGGHPVFCAWRAKGVPISRQTFTNLVTAEDPRNTYICREDYLPHQRWEMLIEHGRNMTPYESPPQYRSSDPKVEREHRRRAQEAIDQSEREIQDTLKRMGFPYRDTDEDYERYLSTNCDRMPKIGHITIESIRNFFFPLIKNRPEFNKAHTYIVGRTGSGKSELLKTIFKLAGTRCVVIDPHGDLSTEAGAIHTRGKTYRIAPNEARFVVNPFDISDRSETNRELVAQEITDLIGELVADSGLTRLMTTIIFPIVYTLLKLDYSDFKTLTDCINPNSGSEKLAQLRNWVEPHHRTIWEELEGDTYDTSKQSIFNRLQSLLNYRLIIQSTTGCDDFETAIRAVDNDDANLVISLPIPTIGEAVAVTLGRFFMTRLQIWAKRRQATPEHLRKPVVLIVDEFHNFISPVTAQTLDQFGRKFKLYMVLAHQHIGQITDREIRGSILANTVNKIAGVSNADTRTAIAKEMLIDPTELENLYVGNFYGRFGNNAPFKFYARMARGNTNPERWTTKNTDDNAPEWTLTAHPDATSQRSVTPPKKIGKPKFDL
jgi:hypothetical protein